jgi:hypothetical protein
MPWKINRKPALVLNCFGYIEFAHRILQVVKCLNRKYK